MSDWYRQLGVSAQKTFLKGLSVESADYFAKVLPDLAGDSAYRFVLHADGIGTKGVLAYLWWRETGDPTYWKTLAQDALVMNTDDLACIGATQGFVFSTILTRNALRIPDAVVQSMIEGVYEFVRYLQALGIEAEVAGGETADMTDVVRTIGLEAVAAVRVRASELIRLRRPADRVHILGLASYGQALYETMPNSGIGCNGLTAARHLLLSAHYAEKYPETVESNLPTPYQGQYLLTDKVAEQTLGALLLSPTRTYLPLLQIIFKAYREAIYTVIHCTGGGQRKALKYLPGTFIRKENFLPLPPIFELLVGLRPWKELLEVFNMGHRIELYVQPSVSEDIIAISRELGILAQVVGEAYPAESTTMEVCIGGQTWRWTPDD